MPRKVEALPCQHSKSLISKARVDGQKHADSNADNPLAMVAIPQAYFRMVAGMAMRSGDPKGALEELLELHNHSARIELRELMGVAR